MRRYLIRVDGTQYEGIFAHGCDAVVDALTRYPDARRVSARWLGAA